MASIEANTSHTTSCKIRMNHNMGDSDTFD